MVFNVVRPQFPILKHCHLVAQFNQYLQVVEFMTNFKRLPASWKSVMGVLKSATTLPGLLPFSASVATYYQWQWLAYVKSFIHLPDKINSPSTSPENIQKRKFILLKLKSRVTWSDIRAAGPQMNGPTENLDTPIIK